MRHLTDKLATRLAMGEASPEQEASAREHAEACSRCRALLEETRVTWAAMDADPAVVLPDTPLWPRVAEALDRTRNAEGFRRRAAAPGPRRVPAGVGGRPAAEESVPVLRPRWKMALAEAWRRPLAYAAILVVLAGVVGGEMAGRTLLGRSSGLAVPSRAGSATVTATAAATATETSSQERDLLAYTALADFPEGSLAALYLGQEGNAAASDAGERTAGETGR